MRMAVLGDDEIEACRGQTLHLLLVYIAFESQPQAPRSLQPTCPLAVSPLGPSLDSWLVACCYHARQAVA
jgi:hypothetical protein